MFKFLKLGRSKTFTEADFDVLGDVTYYDVTLTKDEIVRIFLDWTQEPGRMSRAELARMITDRCANFKERFVGRTLADQDGYAAIFAKSVIEHLQSHKMLKACGRRDVAEFKISPRGEQIRQFYVLKLNLRGTLYDRMDRFAAV